MKPGSKRPVFARPGIMNALGYHLFPSAAFAQEQDGILMLADLLDHFVHALHFHRKADDAAETGTILQLLAQEAVFLLELHARAARSSRERSSSIRNGLVT